MPRLVISAAHTSIAPGSKYKDLKEFDLTRKILQLCINHLNNEKLEYLSVPVDMTIFDRIDWINKTNYSEEQGDIFVEIHINDGGKRGLEAWYRGGEEPDNNSKIFAEQVIKELATLTGYADLGAKSEYKHEFKTLMILHDTMPIAAAFELLFIDNEEDYAILKDEKKLDELAKNLVLAIKKYIVNPPKLNPVKKVEKTQGIYDSFNKNFPSFGSPFDPFSDSDDANEDLFGDKTGLAGSTLTPASAQDQKPSSALMDRDQRKKMIIETYNKFLGKEPAQADLNHFINTAISEEQLLEKIIKSKDHEDLVNDAKQYKEAKERLLKLEAESTSLQSQINDLKAINEANQKLLAQKNLSIKQMQEALQKTNAIQKGQYFDPNNR